MVALSTFNIGNQHVIVRASTSTTGGVCSVLEMHHPIDVGPPLHRHAREDEGFYILQGRYYFCIGETTQTLLPGDFMMAPRGVVHGFRSLGPDLGKMLVYFTPAGCDGYFEEMSRIALDDPHRGEKCARLDERYGITIVARV